MVPFSFACQDWWLLRSGAVFWEAQSALLVADLHLEKASFFARFGQMLPPYDSLETLLRIEAALDQTGATKVFCLGDSFHDAGGAARMEAGAAERLHRLGQRADWVWTTGNHDHATPQMPIGTTLPEIAVSGIALRHEAEAGATCPEISGHWHPKLKLTLRGRRIVRPCAVMSATRLVLPAFGALTGGMDAADPVIAAALQPSDRLHALVVSGEKLVQIPLGPG